MKKYVPILCGLCATLFAGTQAFALNEKEDKKNALVKSLGETIMFNGSERQIPESIQKTAADLLNNNDFSLEQLDFLGSEMDKAWNIIQNSETSLKNLPSATVQELQNIAKETATKLGLTITLSDGLGFSVTDKAGRTYYFGYTSTTTSGSTASTKTSSSASKVIKTTGMDVDYSGSIALLYFAIASIGAAAVVARKKKLFEGK